MGNWSRNKRKFLLCLIFRNGGMPIINNTTNINNSELLRVNY